MSDMPDLDLLAAEYVLGTLEDDAAMQAARLLAIDPIFAAAVRNWEEQLTPLAALAPAVNPPTALWERIETTVAGGAPVVTLRRRVRAWQSATGIALALAASLAAFIVLHAPEPPRFAVLAPISGAPPVLLATLVTNGDLSVRPDQAIQVPTGRDLELWALEAGQTKPRSLGVLPAEGRRLPARLPAGTQLLVSLEPQGGSPTGLPTGPVLYGGRLEAD